MKPIVAFFLFLTPTLCAGEGPRLALQSFLEEVRAANPEIAAAAGLSKAAAARVRQSWLPMDPVLEFERMYADGPLGAGAAERTIAVRQEFRNPYKSRLARNAALGESSYYKGLSGERANKVLAEAVEAFHNYLLSTRTERLYTENLELLRGFARAAESRYAAGRGSQADALKAQVELSKAQGLLLEATQKKGIAAARLNALRNRPPAAAVGAPEEEDFSPEPADYAALEAAALADNPLLKALRARVGAYDSKVTRAKAGYAPDFMVGLRRRSADSAAMDGTYDMSLGLTLPLWFGRNKAELREAKAERAMAEAEYNAARNALLLELKSAVLELDCCANLIHIYDSAVLQAEQALKASRTSYEAGQTSFLELIEAGRALLEVQRESYRSRAEYAYWRARKMSITGEGL
ncbi:MAG: outer membrane efflux protein [Elusimicrobia bacterium]|nr:MAG: outer membrane efflux protein [Elusimicrobiota bacterium]KAF0156874.1 MAG: outer membrane efflux protein [Elusimicrobiota bacterium]